MPLQVTINGERTDVSHIDPDTPLLWALRDHLGLVGTKYGCGVAFFDPGEAPSAVNSMNEEGMRS